MYIRDQGADWGWGVCVNYNKRKSSNDKSNSVSIKSSPQYIVDVLLRTQPSSDVSIHIPSSANVNQGSAPSPWKRDSGVEAEMQVISICLDIIDGISSLRVYLPNVSLPCLFLFLLVACDIV